MGMDAKGKNTTPKPAKVETIKPAQAKGRLKQIGLLDISIEGKPAAIGTAMRVGLLADG